MAGRPVVTLYRREGCPLCDHAMAMLEPLARRMAFAIEPVDIESDDALHRRYVYEIPVVAVGGADVIGWPFTPESLEAALRGVLG
ncbi:MAG TPA: glutaredoxin family protein [Tepidiformaceae bacterium]